MSADETPGRLEQRHLTTYVVKRNDSRGMLFEGGIGYGGHPSLADVQPGETIEIESLGRGGWGGQIVGARRPDGPWLFRKTAEDLITEHAEWEARRRRQDEETLVANRDDWMRREAALPVYLQHRLGYFHARGGHAFALHGWGYELAICEIAVLLEQADLDENAGIVEAYAREHGTTGNQHGMALALAKRHRADPDWSAEGTISALSPLTGDADYSRDA